MLRYHVCELQHSNHSPQHGKRLCCCHLIHQSMLCKEASVLRYEGSERRVSCSLVAISIGCRFESLPRETVKTTCCILGVVLHHGPPMCRNDKTFTGHLTPRAQGAVSPALQTRNVSFAIPYSTQDKALRYPCGKQRTKSRSFTHPRRASITHCGGGSGGGGAVSF